MAIKDTCGFRGRECEGPANVVLVRPKGYKSDAGEENWLRAILVCNACAGYLETPGFRGGRRKPRPFWTRLTLTPAMREAVQAFNALALAVDELAQKGG